MFFVILSWQNVMVEPFMQVDRDSFFSNWPQRKEKSIFFQVNHVDYRRRIVLVMNNAVQLVVYVDGGR